MRKLGENPGIGQWREELTDKGHRFFLVYSYLIVYRHETKPMQIIRVLHAARDVQSILGLTPDTVGRRGALHSSVDFGPACPTCNVNEWRFWKYERPCAFRYVLIERLLSRLAA